jgi:hypothetical protein
MNGKFQERYAQITLVDSAAKEFEPYNLNVLYGRRKGAGGVISD